MSRSKYKILKLPMCWQELFIDRFVSIYVFGIFYFFNIVVCDADILGRDYEDVLYRNTFISRTIKYIC